MKASFSILQSATLLAGAFAQDAFLWTVDPAAVKHTSHQTSSITSDTASTILARRRGITDDRYLRTTDETILQDINKFGGWQQAPFGLDTQIPEKVLIRISGFDGTLSQLKSLPDLWIERPTNHLLDDFKARKHVGGVCEYNLPIPTKRGVDVVYSYHSDDGSCRPVAEVETLPAILTVYSATPTAENVGNDLPALLRMLNHLAATGNVESTVLVLPSPSALYKFNPRRSAQSEEPLDLPIIEAERPTEDLSTPQQSNPSHPLPKVVPQCFTSESTCTNVTNSCSGHGSCYKAHASCFKCKCGTTVLRREAGKKTIQWGGNACQKKDVSMPFALFTTFGIAMTAVVAGGIGMLYSMGAQELPSVLGAGVAGPKAHK